MELVRYSNEIEWTALYVDGKLDTVGDSYLIDDRIAVLANVNEREGDFTCGTNRREGVPGTLIELEDFLQEAEESARTQEQLLVESRIHELEAEVERLRNIKG